MLKDLVLVGLGGAVGSMLRYAVTLLGRCVSAHAAVATLLCNLAGCFLIGLLIGCTTKGMNADLRLLLVGGFCGGFTTFSTFSAEVLAWIERGEVWNAIAYGGISVVLGVALTFVGLRLSVN